MKTVVKESNVKCSKCKTKIPPYTNAYYDPSKKKYTCESCADDMLGSLFNGWGFNDSKNKKG